MHRHRRDRPQPRRCVRDLIMEEGQSGKPDRLDRRDRDNRDNPAHVLHRDREGSPTRCRPDTVARGPVPRERWMAQSPSRYRSARACPSRTLDGPERGGGQAPALRWDGTIFYSVARGPVPRECSMAPGMAGDRPPPYDERRHLLFAPDRDCVLRLILLNLSCTKFLEDLHHGLHLSL